MFKPKMLKVIVGIEEKVVSLCRHLVCTITLCISFLILTFKEIENHKIQESKKLIKLTETLFTFNYRSRKGIFIPLTRRTFLHFPAVCQVANKTLFPTQWYSLSICHVFAY